MECFRFAYWSWLLTSYKVCRCLNLLLCLPASILALSGNLILKAAVNGIAVLTLHWEPVHWSGLTTICGTLVQSWLVWHSSISYFLSVQKHMLWRQHQNSLNPIITTAFWYYRTSDVLPFLCDVQFGHWISPTIRCVIEHWAKQARAKQFAKCLLCANDVTECGLALIPELNTSTHDDEQRHCFEEHRKKFPFLRILWLTFHFCKYCLPANYLWCAPVQARDKCEKNWHKIINFFFSKTIDTKNIIDKRQRID